jgi:hypothetical protein
MKKFSPRGLETKTVEVYNGNAAQAQMLVGANSLATEPGISSFYRR